MDETLFQQLSMILFLQQDNLRDIQAQRHPFHFLAEQYFKHSFFPCVIGEGNKINPETRSSGSYSILRKSLLNFIRPSAGKVCITNINDTISIKLITRPCLGFSHLWEHKFKHNFQYTLNPLCSCSIEAEATSHYFLRCHFFDALRATLMNDLRNTDSDLLTLKDENLTNTLLHGNQIYDDKTNNFNALNTIY